jgi:hypothetical protein
MATTFKDKLEDAGNTIAEKATAAGHRVAEAAEKATDWAKEKVHEAGHRIDETKQTIANKTGIPLSESTGAVGSVADIKEHMAVYASCGTQVGTVDHVQGNQIKLTKSGSPDGFHHLIPTSWVAKVHDHVHLNKDHKEVQSLWETI